MITIKEYLDSLDLVASVKLHATSFIEEIDKFCNKNKNRLNELPSAGQLEQLKNENNSEKLKLMIKYFIEYLVDHIKMSRKDKK